ncbi:hypothetical protein FUSO7_10045 [Fusobacterium necrophorum BFTR-2]|nr:hypothetical protein [Fusobacterium necrophorum]KDE71178.1 hypothetical protein FUSO7_10045 [Fusobacterium necrophorum BFTR-2]
MENKEDMLLLLLLTEIVSNLGMEFRSKQGENINFEELKEMLLDENVKDEFYDLLLEKLSITIENYVKN